METYYEIEKELDSFDGQNDEGLCVADTIGLENYGFDHNSSLLWGQDQWVGCHHSEYLPSG